jgi:NagD protein
MTDYINKIVDKDHDKIVVGDRIHTDIELGKKIGAETVLVCTGEYQNSKNDNLKINNTQIYNTLTDYLLTI